MSPLLLDRSAVTAPRSPATLGVGDSVVVRRQDDTAVAVHRTGRRRYVGHLAVCPHCGATVHAEGPWLCCAFDGSVFAATTGEVLQGPAAEPLDRVEVRVRHAPLIPG